MAKKSPKKDKKALASADMPVMAEKPVKTAKATKAPKLAKAAKATKSTKASKAPKTPTAQATPVATPAEKPTKSPRKKKDAPVVAATSVPTPVTAAVMDCAVEVIERPQPQRHLVVVVSEPEPEEDTAPRFDAVHAGAHTDDAGALYVLGIRYSTGRDVEQDLIAAHKWFNLAAMQGHEGAKSCRADVASEMSKAQIAEAQRQARDWLAARDARHVRESEAAAVPERIKRPTYVRRRAQAMRSAASWARTCACA